MPRPSNCRRGFTLVEMLVVIGIIGVLAALLLGAVMMAVPSTRRAAIVTEITQLSDGFEAYRKDKGDYPPSFRDADAFVRHVRRCYPKIAPSELAYFITINNGQYQWVNQLDEAEALVFWLSLTRNDDRYPFGMTGGQNSPFNKYYEFDETRLSVAGDDGDSDQFRSFHPRYGKSSFYMYVDARSYDELSDFSSSNAIAVAETTPLAATSENSVRPYWSDKPRTNPPSGATLDRDKYLPVNPTTFQILCAGLDGDFGAQDTDVKLFARGDRYKEEDNDNIANFSGGALGDKIP